MGAKSSGRQSFKRPEDGLIYHVGDNVLVVPEGGGADFIANIVAITEPKGPDQIVSVKWYYRPEEIAGGRKLFHGKKEVLRSDHGDDIDAATIRRKCQVVSLEQYQTLPKPVAADVFFTRTMYYAATKTFKPDRVPVYCLCSMPFNPDLDMVSCTRCDEWYHLRCLKEDWQWDGVDRSIFRGSFACKRCKRDGRAP